MDIDNFTIDDVRNREHDISNGITTTVVRQKYSFDPNLKGKPLFQASLSTCYEKRHIKPVGKLNFKKQTFYQTMKDNKNFRNK